MKYIDADKLTKAIKDRGLACSFALKMERLDILALIDELQQEQPEVDLEKTVEFECIGKKVKMTVQELINYYIDSECVAVAEECGF